MGRFANTKGLKTLLNFLHKVCFHLNEEHNVDLAEKILAILKKLTISQDLLFFPDVRSIKKNILTLLFFS